MVKKTKKEIKHVKKKMVKTINGKKYVAVADGQTGKKFNYGNNRKDALIFAENIMYDSPNEEWKLIMEKNGNKRIGVLYIREKNIPKKRFMKKGHRYVGDKDIIFKIF